MQHEQKHITNPIITVLRIIIKQKPYYNPITQTKLCNTNKTLLKAPIIQTISCYKPLLNRTRWQISFIAYYSTTILVNLKCNVTISNICEDTACKLWCRGDVEIMSRPSREQGHKEGIRRQTSVSNWTFLHEAYFSKARLEGGLWQDLRVSLSLLSSRLLAVIRSHQSLISASLHTAEARAGFTAAKEFSTDPWMMSQKLDLFWLCSD